MHLAPRLEMAGGESIHSLPDPDDPDRPFDDAAQVALRFQALGARRLHVVDVDHATEHGDNDVALADILEVVGMPVDVGGGVRSMKRIQQLLDSGVAHVLVGTMGLKHADWLKEVGVCFGRRVIHTLDLREARLMLNGRRDVANVAPLDFVRQVDAYGLGGIVVNAVDAADPAAALAPFAEVAPDLSTPLWLGVQSCAWHQADAWRRAGVEGLVVGQGLYDGRTDLGDLLGRLQQDGAVG